LSPLACLKRVGIDAARTSGRCAAQCCSHACEVPKCAPRIGSRQLLGVKVPPHEPTPRPPRSEAQARGLRLSALPYAPPILNHASPKWAALIMARHARKYQPPECPQNSKNFPECPSPTQPVPACPRISQSVPECPSMKSPHCHLRGAESVFFAFTPPAPQNHPRTRENAGFAYKNSPAREPREPSFYDPPAITSLFMKPPSAACGKPPREMNRKSSSPPLFTPLAPLYSPPL
jgi:hypothetical protein